MLERVRAGFDDLGARWEVARTDLILARWLRRYDLHERSAGRARTAAAVFSDLRVPRELGAALALVEV